MDKSIENRELNIPAHVAIIMDGNGRWAKKQGKPRVFGHKRGADVLEDIVRDADSMGIKYLTVYAFSTENWNRPEAEVSALMTLFGKYLRSTISKAMDNNMRCRVIGERSRLSPDIQQAIEEFEGTTRNNTGLTLTIAINYGSRDEIRRAVAKIAEKAAKGIVAPEDITEQMISDELDTSYMPDPDLVIRTCGEQRLSNYLMWQSAYAELYFSDRSWPEFDRSELERAVEAYSSRTRKFGKVL